MRSRSQIIDDLVEPGIIAVVRARQRSQVIPLAEALVEGGLRAIEITTTTPEVFQAIKEASEHFGSRALIGVGTVLDADTCQRALDAGAEFVVSPITRQAVLEVAHAQDRPVMLGAYTPTEAQLAHEMGADFIKLFPADGLGPAFVKALRAPLPHLRIVPTGGVDVDSAPNWIRAGCAALGVGSSLLKSEWIDGKKWVELTGLARQFVCAVRSARIF
jgi:2-dehydro-3-deoxyphosphogluconate aldolase / (4S)-4-hydroxy-2-oxoglutarate aldolase